MPFAFDDLRGISRRWLVFNVVGTAGIVVQLALLGWLLAAGLDYLVATALAVEVAVLNNFLWHELWTWRDRTVSDAGRTVFRLVRFNATVGTISIAQNLIFMRVLVGHLDIHPLVGNAISIGVCGLANFAVSELFVFGRPTPCWRRVAAGTIGEVPSCRT